MIPWLAIAWAQSGPVPGDALRTSVDAEATVGVDDSALHAATGRITLGWGHYGAVARREGSVWLGDTAVGVASAGATAGPVRVGIAVPVWLATGTGWEGAKLLAGDWVLDVKAIPQAARSGAPGVGVVARLTVPMGGWSSGMGYRPVTGELGVLVDGRAGPVWMGFNAGWRILPTVELGSHRLDDVAWGRLGVGVGGRVAGVGVEAWGQVVPVAPSWSTSPIDLLGSAWVAIPTPWDGDRPAAHARLAVGGSAVAAVGSPSFRMIFELGAAIPKPTRR